MRAGATMRKSLIISGCITLLISSILCTNAEAQAEESLFSRDRNVSVKERSRPDYETNGLRWGAWTLNPQIEAGVEFNNNIFATETATENDVIAVVTPSSLLESNWSIHYLSVQADYSRREYFDFTDESVSAYGVRADGRLDVKSNSSIGTGAAYRYLTEPRTSAGAANRSAKPIEYDITSGYLTGNYETGRVQLKGLLDFTSSDYDDALLNDGSIADQDFRDVNEISILGRSAYAVSPSTAVFMSAQFIDQDYDFTDLASSRDQTVSIFNVGADFDISNLIRGEIGLGYFDASFESSQFENVDGLSISAGVEWFPTPLITVSSQAARDIRAAALAASPAFVSTSLGGAVDYEFRRNIIFSAGLNYADESYENIDRTDERISGYIGGSYLLNRSIGLSLNVLNSSLTSKGNDRQSDFDSTVISFGITLRR